jgi:PadR family transcriptional regulator, regulatory protein PadR
VENKQLINGSLNVIILKLLSQQESMYGYEICQKVKEITKGGVQITEGALYPALHKLESEGVITFESKKVNGRTRKYYMLSEEGHRRAVPLIAEANAFLEQIKLLLNLKPAL